MKCLCVAEEKPRCDADCWHFGGRSRCANCGQPPPALRNYCPTCGAQVSAPDRYCSPNCFNDDIDQGRTDQ